MSVHRLDGRVVGDADGLSLFLRSRTDKRVHHLDPHDIAAGLEAFDCDAVKVEGPHAAFTAPLFGALIDWSLRRPERTFAIQPSVGAHWRRENLAGFVPRAGEAGADYPLAVCGDTIEEFGPPGRRDCGADTFLDRLSGGGPYFAVAITGHGAEYCLKLGSAWLSTHENYGLKGRWLNIDDVETSLVLLNGCGTLQLADSVVPARHSLAMALAAKGIAVAGPYRNIRSSRRIEQAFVDLTLSGLPAGHVVRALNCLLRDVEGDVPCFVLIGDADRSLPPQFRRASDDRHPFVKSDRVAALGRLSENIDTLHRLRALFLDMRLWAWALNRADALYASVERIVRTASMAMAVEPRTPLPDDDIAVLNENLAQAIARFRAAMLDDVVQWIQSGRWLQAAYAPVTGRSVGVSKPCMAGHHCQRGGGFIVDYRYAAFGAGGPPINARECDRCGSKAEWMGATDPAKDLDVRIEGDTLIAELPPLEPKEAGRIALHRCAQVAPVAWPAAGGVVEIDARGSAVHGRVTLVALRLGAAGVCATYTHLFRNPENGAWSTMVGAS